MRITKNFDNKKTPIDNEIALKIKLLAEIDKVLQSTEFWIGGRLDTIKSLIAECRKLRGTRTTTILALKRIIKTT